jgi:hypothetical protein
VTDGQCTWSEMRSHTCSGVWKCMVYYLKCNPNINHLYCLQMKSEARLHPCMKVKLRSPWLLGRCSRQLRESSAGANMLYSRAERVFILDHYFAQKSFSAVREALSSASYDDDVPHRAMTHRPATKCLGYRKCLSATSAFELQSSWDYTILPISGSVSAATAGYGCKISISWSCHVVREGVAL